MIDLDAIRAARERLAEAERAAYRPKPGEDPIAALPELDKAERAVINAVMGRMAGGAQLDALEAQRAHDARRRG